MAIMHRNKSVDVHQFAMVPRPEVPRSSFRKQHTHKTTFDENYLIPVYADEVLPGDTFSLRMTAFARVATPIFPIMDNLYLESFFFFVPNRLIWSNWVKFMGQQTNPADSIAYNMPTLTSPVGGYAANSVFDYFGLPTAGQVGAGNTVTHTSLPLRAYNLIYNEWFRDENLINSYGVAAGAGDGPDAVANFFLAKRAKRHDYFTSCLPWTQKGGTAITVPIGGQATVKTNATALVTGAQQGLQWTLVTGSNPSSNVPIGIGTSPAATAGTSAYTSATGIYPSNLFADLSTATSVTINQLRQSFQIQRLLERDARGGTRYTEVIRAHFGVISPDARLQRPEYLGGGSQPVNISPIAQTSGTGLTGGTTPLGNLAAFGTMLAQGHGFTQSFTEHGYIIGLVNVRADVTYQQGLRKMWSRVTRYDHYFPAFAMLGEQAVLNKELYVDGSANDALVFGYNERWAEYRYHPSMVTGQFRSTYATPLDAWHLAEKFTALPTLSQTFIESNVPMSRVVAVASAGARFIFDSFFDVKATRPMPLYSVPGMIDHF